MLARQCAHELDRPPAFLRPARAGPRDEADLAWVALGMHLTLVEVDGEKGRATWPLPLTRARLEELLDPARHVAQVFLAVAPHDPADIAGHTILRLDAMPDGRRYGLVSTTYVDPAHRRAGIADALLEHGEAWIRAQGVNEAATWTSAANVKLIRLYEKHGFAVTETGAKDGSPMVRLAKPLTS